MSRRPKIVVIDDSEIVLAVAKNALESAGYDVVTHDRPAGCVALILHEKPELVLMDVNMPGLGGDTIVSVLAKAAPTSDTVVLLHSSLSAEVLRSKATAAGAHGFIQKSGDLFALSREVNRWLKVRTSSGSMIAARPIAAEERSPSGTHAAVKAAAPSSGSAAPSSGSATRPSGTLRVAAPTLLLVDDDMAVLSGFRRHLQAEDISIEFALSGGQALRRMLSDTPPDAVVCDMLLPDISGVEVFRRAVEADPSYRQRFAVATGGAAVPEVAMFLASFGGPVLKKPIEAAQLSRAVRSCLTGARGTAKSLARS
ncbi:MAG TPA: response regulator [Polyangiaceae bacterium]|nr:response regulator [Polyangiaceae bacterium]